MDFYRFSLSWSRILPNGYGNVISQEGLDYYKNLIDELLANNIEPFVTLYHWDHPEVFEMMGGWTNDMMVNWTSDYARIVFRELGPKVKYFATINEPSVVCTEAYASNRKAPGILFRFIRVIDDQQRVFIQNYNERLNPYFQGRTWVTPATFCVCTIC